LAKAGFGYGGNFRVYSSAARHVNEITPENDARRDLFIAAILTRISLSLYAGKGLQ
jgi:hypothetical protein